LVDEGRNQEGLIEMVKGSTEVDELLFRNSG
jgi:hypothetical protein